jgi:ribulose-5-phosphate 4-epimerase/fuculose-1-phosphate aldolase
VFDISKYYAEHDVRDLLVRNVNLAAALASYFSDSSSNGESNQEEISHSAVLMRGHGFTVVGSSIEECVLRAVYTAENAAVQTTSLTTNAAYYNGSHTANEVQYLRPDELGPATNMTKWSSMRPWNLWLREVELAGLYVNNAA